MLGLFIASFTASVFAQSLSADKTYTISNNNDANMFMQDNGKGGVSLAVKNDNAYWKFVATENADCYYIQNAKTGKYIQGYNGSEQEVATGDEGVEYYVKADADGSLAGKFRMSCTANSPYDFSSGTLGLNWKNNNTVQSFASVAGGNPRSAWIVTEEVMPEPVEPEPASLTSPWVGSALAEGEFYLYNVESGLWLQNNDSKSEDWSTRAAIGTRGFEWNIVASDGAYALQPNFYVNNSSNMTWSINPGNNYIDTSDGQAWSVTPVEKAGLTNTYVINCGNKVLGTVNYKEAGRQENLFTQTGDARWYLENPDYNVNMSERNTWQFVTRQERLEKMMAEASAENPVDASWLIPGADLANNDKRLEQWIRNFDGGNNPNGGDGGVHGSRCQESWNSNSIDYSITLNVPNGTYRFTLQGYYRDGGRSDVISRRGNGTETIRSYYFANNVEHPLMSILDDAKSAEGTSGYGYSEGGLWYPDSHDDANRCFNLHKGYVNEEIEVVVTAGTLKIGVKKSEKSENDWTVFDNFHLTYLGNTIDISDYVDALTDAIEAAEAFDTKTTSAVLADELADAIADGKAALSSTDSEVLSAAAGAINTALDAAKAVNIVELSQNIAVAEEGVDLTEANNVIENGRTADEVNHALFALRTARKINALGFADVFTGSAPEADGEYFLYNIGTGMWMNHGSDWNTHAAVDVYPLPVKLIAAEDGKFKMQTHMFKNRDEKWINWNTYVDTGDQNTWTFNPVEGKENVYTINSEGNRTDVGRLFGYDPFGPTDKGNYWYWSNVTKDREGVDNPNNQWKLVTRAEMEALAEKATETNPVDVSYLIENGGLSRVWSLDMYSKECDGGNGGAHITSGDDNNFDRNSDYGYEVWNASSFSFTQELNNLKPGVYEVSVSGFFREGDGNYQAGVVNNGGDLISEAYLVANGETACLPNIATEAGKLPGIFSQDCVNGTFANWPREALAAFETGLYGGTKVKCVVGFDGKLTFGVKQDQKTTDNSWVLFDTFRLTYLGPVQIETMSIVGDFTGGWELENAVEMTQDGENPAIWRLEIEDFEVTIEEGQTERKYEYKATANGMWGAYELPAQGNKDWVFGTEEYPAGVYDLLFTVDTEKHELTVEPILNETTTGISEQFTVQSAESTVQPVVFNLQGQKMVKTNKGLYIVNGKKLIVK